MSISGQIMDHLTSLPKERLSSQDPVTVANAINAAPDKVSKLMWSLEHTGRIALIRDGRSITGVSEITRAAGRQGVRSASPRATTSNTSVGPRSMRTPMLDKYEHAKNKASTFNAGEDAEFFEVSFRDNPIAEEGLRLRAALARCEDQYRELSSQYKLILYENEGLKDRVKQRTNGVAAEIAKRDADLARDAK